MKNWLAALVPVGETMPETPSPVRNYDNQLDSITSILGDICESLEEGRSVRFLVAGFGEDAWPVDVHTDLAVVIEQVPNALKQLQDGTEAVIGFYEQGIEREVSVVPHGSEAVLACRGLGGFAPNPSVVRMPLADVIVMLQTLLRDFSRAAHVRCPDLVAHPWFSEWLHS